MLALPHTFKLETKNYVAEKLLGQGAEGSVYRGYEEGDPSKLVAIKYCSNMRNDELQFLMKYILKKDHSNIINYFDIHVATNEMPCYIFVMELGETNLLDKVINRRHNLELNEILDIILQIATGIQTMHKIGYIHRDIKPENIILVNGKWKICDFGLTRNKLSTLTKKIGTAYYIAPEMIQTIEDSSSIEQYDVKVDIWALGCLIYEIYTTKLFFNGSNFEDVIKGVQEFIFKYRSGIPDHPWFKNLPATLENIVKKMLVVDKNNRLTIDEVIKEIQDLIKPVSAVNPLKTFRPGTKSNDPQQQQIPGNQQPVNQFPQPQQNNIPRNSFPVFSGQKPVFQQQFSQNPPPNFQFPPGTNSNQTFTQNPPPQIFQQSNIPIQPSINSQPSIPFFQQKMQEPQSQQPQNQQNPSFPKPNQLNPNVQNVSFPNQTKVYQQSIQSQPTSQNVFAQAPGQSFQASMVPQVAQNLQSQQQQTQNQLNIVFPKPQINNFQPQDQMAKQPSLPFQNNQFQQQQQNNLSITQKLSENTQNQIKFSPAQQQNCQNNDQKDDTLSNGNSAQSKSFQIQQILLTKYVKLNSASIQNKLKLSSTNEDESQICSKLVIDITEIVGNLFLENHRPPIQQGSS